MYQKCPVCNGKRHVPPGFYGFYSSTGSHNGKWETCKTCSGSGVIRDDLTPYTVNVPRKNPEVDAQ